MFVKICGITSEEDALFATAMGADAVGFVMAPSTRQVSPQQARDIARRLPPEVLTVGVFRNELPARVIDIVHASRLRVAQLHGQESLEQVRQIAQAVPAVIKAFTTGTPELDRSDQYPVDAILVDGATPGSGEIFDWRMLDGVSRGHPLLLAGGLTPDNVADAVHQVRPWGVDVSTGVEKRSGVKDPLKVRAFIRSARAAAGQEAMPEPLGDRPFDWVQEG